MGAPPPGVPLLEPVPIAAHAMQGEGAITKAALVDWMAHPGCTLKGGESCLSSLPPLMRNRSARLSRQARAIVIARSGCALEGNDETDALDKPQRSRGTFSDPPHLALRKQQRIEDPKEREQSEISSVGFNPPAPWGTMHRPLPTPPPARNPAHRLLLVLGRELSPG
jgi:hypothetical protein